MNVKKEEKIKNVVAKTKVVHNKRNYCPFCKESKVNFLPHLKQLEEEEEVAVIFKLPSRDTERNQRIDQNRTLARLIFYNRCRPGEVHVIR